MKRYDLLDHTADIGIIAFGKSLPEAFGNAAYAMFDILTDVEKIREDQGFEIQVSAINIEELLVVWLDELLFRYETERIIFKRFEISELTEKELKAMIFGEKIDKKRHEIKVEIKNVTYHQLKIEKTPESWKIQVIFDL